MIMKHNLIVSVIVTIFSSVSHGWNYKEQDKWPETCQNSIAQSPIDLNEYDMLKIDTGRLLFRNWDKDYNATMTNNGHTVLVELSNKEPIAVAGGGLPGVYNLVQFHFHWGAEHTLNKKRKALESHFVTYNTKYKSIDEAMKYRNGIAVLAVLYEVQEFASIRNAEGKILSENFRFVQPLNGRTVFEVYTADICCD